MFSWPVSNWRLEQLHSVSVAHSAPAFAAEEEQTPGGSVGAGTGASVATTGASVGAGTGASVAATGASVGAATGLPVEGRGKEISTVAPSDNPCANLMGVPANSYEESSEKLIASRQEEVAGTDVKVKGKVEPSSMMPSTPGTEAL